MDSIDSIDRTAHIIETTLRVIATPTIAWDVKHRILTALHIRSLQLAGTNDSPELR
jgi:hypothetical protein